MNGVIGVVLAVGLSAISVAWFWVSSTDGAVVGAGAATVLLAILSALIAGFAFQVAARPSDALPLAGPLMLFTILTVVIGFTGAMLGIVLGGITGSVVAIFAGTCAFIASLAVALQGALVYGAAKHRV